MPTFDTPEPISVTVELGVGDLRIVAADRSDTIVEVRPSDAAKKSDVAAAEHTRVELDGGRLLIKAPKGWRQWTLRGGGESIDVEVALPAGSDVRVEAGVAALRCAGRLGECHFKAGVGEIRVEQAGPVQVKTGGGDITVERALEHAELTTGSGVVQIGSIDGTAEIKNSNGDTWIGEVTGELTVRAANGRIAVDHADAGVEARTANGDVRLGEVASGAVLAETGHGKLDIAIRDGVAAWLDLGTRFGRVDNGLEEADRPGPGEDAVEVRARSSFGDITVRRSPATDTGNSR
jgi:Putative adhesin